MVKFFAHYDAESLVVQGFYRSDLHAEIPEPNLEIAEALYEIAGDIAGPSMCDPDSGEVFAAPAAEVSIEEIRERAMSTVILWINQLTAQMSQGYPSGEVATWPKKAIEAETVLAGGDAGPLIATEALESGESELETATRINARAQATSRIMGKVTAIRRRTATAIEAAGDAAAVNAALEAALAEGHQKALDEGLQPPAAAAFTS